MGIMIDNQIYMKIKQVYVKLTKQILIVTYEKMLRRRPNKDTKSPFLKPSYMIR